MNNTITRDSVRLAAMVLINTNGKTTSLEVKKTLRAAGYWAKQDQVREFLLDITENDGDIAYRNNVAGYREYYLKNSSDTDTTDDVTTDDDTSVVVKSTKPNSDNVPGSYAVWDGSNYSTRMTYTGRTRGQAKNAWAKTFGRSFFEARTKRLSW